MTKQIDDYSSHDNMWINHNALNENSIFRCYFLSGDILIDEGFL